VKDSYIRKDLYFVFIMTPEQTTIFRRFAKCGIVLASTGIFLLQVPGVIFAKTCTDPADAKKTITVADTAPCPTTACPPGKLCNPVKSASINEFLMDAVGEVVKYGLILIVFFLVLAGFKFVVAQGNPEKISEARKMLVWVIVGAFVLLGVYVIKAAVCGTIDKISADTDKKACQ